MSISIVRARPGDEETIVFLIENAQICERCNPHYGITSEDIYLSDGMYAKEFRSWGFIINANPATTLALVARFEEMIIGVCHCINEPPMRMINELYVDPEFHRQGIGTKLLTTAFTWFGQGLVSLPVLEYNTPARSFYRTMGFREDVDSKYWIKIKGKDVPVIRMTKKI